SCWVPCVKRPLRTWRRKGSALRCIANGSACSVDLSNRPECNSSTCVRGGRHYSLQAQGDFRAIAARQCHLHLISKLRADSALYWPYTGPYAGRGPRRKYGRKVHYDDLPVQYLQETTVEGHIQTRLYQTQLLHKEFAQPLNVVIIAKTNLRTQARAHVVLFSS